jgi:hypothetical protein
MSMSQEEIEALMSGAGDVSLDENEEAVSQETSSEEEEQEPVIEDLDGEASTEEAEAEDSAEDDNINELLAGIDGIVDDEPQAESKSESDDDSNKSIEELIDQNQYPLPVKSENKVVNQLNQVADDSEEKASQIFDVLSFILDENNEIANYNKNMGEFIQKQTKLLTALTTKFPNINVFKTNLEMANGLVESSNNLAAKVDAENNKVFEAMELMQYHDINRQKIERVMAVIRKLNSYLNGIFEDESDRAEVQIAKHISGDDNETVDADDLEALISQFSSEGQ